MSFDGESIKTTALGGSETAGYYVTKELAARGHDVTLFCKCPQEGVWGGVRYRHLRFFQEWAGSEPHDITVIQRVPGPFTIRLASPVHLWWMHDLALRRFIDGVRGVLWNTDKILTVSEWMRQQYIETYGLEPHVVHATRNGIDLDLIRSVEGPLVREKLLVFTARPERGMDIFLGDVLPRIIKQVPDVGVALAGYENYVQELAPLYARIQQLVAQYGGRVRHLGGLAKPDLYRLYKRAAVYVYPTAFEEVSPARGDTLIDTPGGKFRIDSLVGRTNFPVYAYDEQNKRIAIAKVRWVKRTRVNTPMLTIRYRYGIGCKANYRGELTVTPDHEIMLRNGCYVQARKLQPGDRIMPFNRNKTGGTYQAKAGRVPMHYTKIYLNDGQVVSEARFVLEWKLGRPLRPGEHVDHLDSNQTNNAPENLQVVQGHRGHRLAHFDRMTSAEKEKLFARRSTYLQAHRDSLTPEELFAEKSRASLIGWERRRAALNHEVLEIVPAPNADGYCMSVTPHHNFVANGVVVHNCITAMECAACGLPFVASHLAALPETCIPEASLLVPYDEKQGAHNPEFLDRFADEVVALLKDGNRRAAMGAAGMAGAERYRWSGVAAEWEALAESLMPAMVRYE
jgi:glycosyltransferase involved in cell wall biosynthesis